MPRSEPIPVLLVTGVLGAGKTTLINRLLRADHGLRLAAIVNDFGAINIDAELLADAAEGVVGLKNGCICCSLQGDLLRTLKTVMQRDPGPQAIVIEASGVADPRPVMQALADPVLLGAVRLDAVCCVVDAECPTPDDPLWQAQVAASDIIALSKSRQDETALTARLAAMGKTQVHPTDGPDALSLPLLLAVQGAGLGPEPFVPLKDTRFAHLEWQSDGTLPFAGLQRVIEALAPDLARAKGLLAFDEKPGRRYLLQMVGTRVSLTETAGVPDGCRLVFIGPKDRFDPAFTRTLMDRLAALSAQGTPA